MRCVRCAFSLALEVAVRPFGQLLLGRAPLSVEQVVGDQSLTGLGGCGEPLAEFRGEVGVVAEVVQPDSRIRFSYDSLYAGS